MPLHPEAAAARARRAAEGTRPLYSLSLAEARAADLADIQAGAGAGEPVDSVGEQTIPGPGGTELRIRIYEPGRGATGRPALVYFFGGGWTLGNLETCDGICRSLTNAAQCVTISVGYRPAPEHPFPAAVEDCHAAVRWVAENAAALGIDPTRLAVGGDSAGGNLAAAVTLLARDDGPELRHQLLVYPNTDYLAGTASLRANDDPLLFNRRSVPGIGATTSRIRPTGPTRWPRRCAPGLWPACRPRRCSPRSSTRCATRASGMPNGCAPTACRCRRAGTPACRTASSPCPASSPSAARPRPSPPPSSPPPSPRTDPGASVAPGRPVS
jgi:acetyl esterase/lipase